MKRAFLGFTFLLAGFFPMFVPYVHGWFGGYNATMYGQHSIFGFHSYVLVGAYLPAALVTFWFFESSKLRQRLPGPVAGANLLITGVAIVILIHFISGWAPRIWPSLIGVGQHLVWAGWLAKVLLVAGAARLLLSLHPLINRNPQ